MRVINAYSQSIQPGQGVSGPAPIIPRSAQASGDDEFSSMMEAIISPNASNQVSEEALFAALTVERVKSLKGEETASRYQELLSLTESNMMVGSYIPHEDAARMALRDFRDGGSLSREEADKVHSEAFGAAQLDDNDSALYDDIGGAGDPTFAALDKAEAISLAKIKLDQYSSGELSATHRALDDGFSEYGEILVNPYNNGSSSASDPNNAPAPESGQDETTTESQSLKLAPGELMGAFINGDSGGSAATQLLLRSSLGRVVVEEGYGSAMDKASSSKATLSKSA